MGFTKLDRGILQSSIMAEDPGTFKAWIVLLAACDADGISRVSPVFVSTIAHLPMKTVAAAIKRLSDPDPESRSMIEEGRRIRRVDGGFEIINYQVYKTRSLRDAEAERKRLYRQENPSVRAEEAERRRLARQKNPSPSNSPSKKNRETDTDTDTEPSGDVRTTSDGHRTDIEERISQVSDRWNEFARKAGIPWIKGVEPGSSREKNLKARIREGFDIEKVIEAIHHQPFLTGDNKDGWLVSFDWILNPANVTKILDGAYVKIRRGDAARRAPDDPRVGGRR